MTAIIFLLLFAGGLGLCLFRHPIYGLYTYVAVFYLHPPSRWWAAALPDLRWSPMNRTEQACREVVIDGARKDHGMVSFAPVLSAADAEQLEDAPTEE